MKSTIITKLVEKTVAVEEKTINLEMTERQAEILYHFMGHLKTEDLAKNLPKSLNFSKNVLCNSPDAISFRIYDALSKHFDSQLD